MTGGRPSSHLRIAVSLAVVAALLAAAVAGPAVAQTQNDTTTTDGSITVTASETNDSTTAGAGGSDGGSTDSGGSTDTSTGDGIGFPSGIALPIGLGLLGLVSGLGYHHRERRDLVQQHEDELERINDDLGTVFDETGASKPDASADTRAETLVSLAKKDEIVLDEDRPSAPIDALHDTVDDFARKAPDDSTVEAALGAVASFDGRQSAKNDVEQALGRLVSEEKRRKKVQDSLQIYKDEYRNNKPLPDDPSHVTDDHFDRQLATLREVKQQVRAIADNQNTPLVEKLQFLVVDYEHTVQRYQTYRKNQESETMYLDLDRARAAAADLDPRSSTASDLVDVLTGDAPYRNIDDVLPKTVRSLDEYHDWKAALKTAESKPELERRAGVLHDDISEFEGAIDDILSNRLDDIMYTIETDASLIDRYEVTRTIAVLEDVVGDLSAAQSAPNVAVETQIDDLSDAIATVEERYVHNPSRDHYNHMIPLHFLGLTDDLLDRAESAAARGDEEIARAYVSAGEDVLEAVEQLYRQAKYNTLLEHLPT